MDTTERNAVSGGDWSTAARCAVRRGDRLAAVGALARLVLASGQVRGTTWERDSQITSRVRDLLCDLLPCPVGAWVSIRESVETYQRPRAPRLTPAEQAMITQLARASRAA